MSKKCNFMIFAAILGASLVGNVFAHETATTKEVVSTATTEEVAPVVQPADVAKEVKKASCKKLSVKKVKAEKVETVPPVDTTTAPVEKTPTDK